jgi:hypothetical protein
MLLFDGEKDLRVLNILKNSLSFLKHWKFFLAVVFFCAIYRGYLRPWLHSTKKRLLWPSFKTRAFTKA